MKFLENNFEIDCLSVAIHDENSLIFIDKNNDKALVTYSDLTKKVELYELVKGKRYD
ncbi:MAG: hypothetical protein KHY88_00365 [Erysipelotrichaceae bacterium]|nr:hypothetical protein [Erysipelotrichaceae bacterium]